MKARNIRPLTGFGILMMPVLRLFTHDRVLLERRAKEGRKIIEERQAERALKRELAKEAKLFAELIQDCYTRLGEAHIPRSVVESSEGRRRRSAKVQKVQFEVCKTTPEVLHFKIKVRRRSVLRPWILKNALPYRVFVGDLVRDETIRELEFATERHVEAIHDDPRYGAWIQVYRNQGVGGIPKNVLYRDMLEKYPADMSYGHIVLGVGINRAVHAVSIEEHPHTLIGGSNGSGKSNMVNQLICSLLRFTDPADLKFILIDLKRLEFSYYKRCGHLHKPIVVEAEDAIDSLQELVNEIKRRTALMDERAKKLSEFNELYPNERLPRLICVIDEFAELMFGADANVAKEAERLVKRISNLGRAVGIHLWICTQRPDSHVISNAVKINMPLVIAGRTQNAAQSGVILGNGEAAKLPLVPGRMIYQSGSQQHVIQAPYISREEILESVAISSGRAAGIIAIEHTDPIIIRDGLIKYLAEHEMPITASLKGLGITAAMMRQFIKTELVTKEHIIGNDLYELRGDTIVKVDTNAPPVLTIVPVPPAPQRSVEDDQAARTAKALEMMREIRARKAERQALGA
jgi:hypothetical protein